MAEGGISQDSVLGQHDEYFEYTCTRCEKRGRNTEAPCYCQTCHQYFCSSCRRVHGEFASDHVVLEMSESDLWGIPQFTRQDTEECPIHEGQQITIYCGQHEALCCAVCTSLDHGVCSKKDFVPDLARNITDSQEMKSIVSNISTIQRRLKKVRNTKSQQKTSLKDSQTNLKETMKEFRTQVDAFLRNLEKVTDQNMIKLYQERDSDLQNHLDKCDQLIQEFDDLQTKLSDPSIGEAKRFIIMKNGKDKMLHGTELINALSQPVNYDITFSLDKTILETMEGVEDLGKFGQNIEPGTSTGIKGVNNFREYKIRADVDKKTCDIQGMCMLADGTVILSDHNNRNIKRLDWNYATTEACSMPGNPNGVCCIGKREVAVALGSKKKVQIVSVTDRMRTTEELSFKHNCNGIAYCKDRLYLTQGCLNSALCEYTLKRSSSETTCTLIRTFDGNFPTSVAVSGDGNFVYLVGTDDKLTIKSRHGGYVKFTEHPNMKKYGEKPGVCVDMKGNVIVSLKFHGLIQFKDSGTKPNGFLIKDQLTKPEVAFVDTLRCKLIVQRNNAFGGSDTVGVWDIVY